MPPRPVSVPKYRHHKGSGQAFVWAESALVAIIDRLGHGQFARQADRPLHLKDFCQHTGTKDLSRAARHVRRAEQAGLMRKIGWVGGRVAME